MRRSLHSNLSNLSNNIRASLGSNATSFAAPTASDKSITAAGSANSSAAPAASGGKSAAPAASARCIGSPKRLLCAALSNINGQKPS